MGLTRTRKLHIAGDLPACTAAVVHAFDDGWSVRTPITLGDIHREGAVLSNCLALEDADFDEFGPGWAAIELLEDGYDAYRSLRDPDNLPRLMWRCDEDDTCAIISELAGAHNCPPTPTFLARARQWAADLGKPCWLYAAHGHQYEPFNAAAAR